MFPQLRAFVGSIYGVIILALLAALIVQTVRIEGFKLWPVHIHGLKEQAKSARDKAASLQSQLNDLAAKSKAQQKAVGKQIKEIITRDDGEARRIEKAELPGNCVTPKAILEADL